MNKPKINLRTFLETPESLSYISYNISKRRISVDSDTLTELQSAVVESLLAQEDYYENKFEYGIKTYINLVITQVLGRYERKPDALNGELVYLDAPLKGVEWVDSHEIINEDNSLTGSSRTFTEAGMPDTLTYYLAQLPEQQADVFALKAVYGHTYEEVCSLLGISLSYAEKLFLEAKRELIQFRKSEEAYEARLQIGNTSGRIITNECSDAGVWNDWSWREEHAEAGPVKQYSQAEIADYCQQ